MWHVLASFCWFPFLYGNRVQKPSSLDFSWLLLEQTVVLPSVQPRFSLSTQRWFSNFLPGFCLQLNRSKFWLPGASKFAFSAHKPGCESPCQIKRDGVKAKWCWNLCWKQLFHLDLFPRITCLKQMRIPQTNGNAVSTTAPWIPVTVFIQEMSPTHLFLYTMGEHGSLKHDFNPAVCQILQEISPLKELVNIAK